MLTAKFVWSANCRQCCRLAACLATPQALATEGDVTTAAGTIQLMCVLLVVQLLLCLMSILWAVVAVRCVVVHQLLNAAVMPGEICTAHTMGCQCATKYRGKSADWQQVLP